MIFLNDASLIMVEKSNLRSLRTASLTWNSYFVFENFCGLDFIILISTTKGYYKWYLFGCIKLVFNFTVSRWLNGRALDSRPMHKVGNQTLIRSPLLNDIGGSLSRQINAEKVDFQ